MKPISVINSASNEQLLYFTSSSITSDDSCLIFISDRTGHPNIFVLDLGTGKERQLTFNRDGYLRTYKYFLGAHKKGLAKAGIALDEDRKLIYYILGMQIRCVDISGNDRVLAQYPEDQSPAYIDVSHDGARLCVPTIDERALQGDFVKENAAPYNIDKRVQDENLNSYIHVYDTGSGREIIREKVPKCWITHVQFCPTNRDLILYNNEWPSDCGVRRIWLWDGVEHRKLRTLSENRDRQDWVSHEMWEKNGEHIIYHGRYVRGDHFIGRMTKDGTDITEIMFPKNYTKYGHFTVGKSGYFLTDGYYEQADIRNIKELLKKILRLTASASRTSSNKGEWVSILMVDWSKKTIKWFPLVKHNSDWLSEDYHPHPIFNHRHSAVFFTARQNNKRTIFKILLPDHMLG
ncbi:MAG: hypothetical protein NTZ95_03600 [Candidatus Omnitrophica bacterium]|nr:hypothetical protein [Candidatus Omnitrophota bacterium]